MAHLKKIILISACVLTACAPPRPASEAPINETMPVEARERKTSNVSSFVIKGALAAKNKNKSWTASLNWRQQSAAKYQIRLFGPLGSGTVIIEKNGGLITFKDGDKQVKSSNPDQLLYEQTGIRLPVKNLYYWVRGLPAPGAIQNKSYDNFNHLKTIKQGGYHVTYLAYTSKGQVDLPSKIKLTGHGVFMKLIIKSWTV